MECDRFGWAKLCGSGVVPICDCNRFLAWVVFKGIRNFKNTSYSQEEFYSGLGVID